MGRILTEPAFLLSFAVVLVVVATPLLLARGRDFVYAVLYDGAFRAKEGHKEIAGEKIQALRVVAVEIRNSSGLNIERSHYVRPITVDFGKEANILDAEVIEEEPPGIGITLRGLPQRDPGKVALEPVLLNDGDTVLLEIVVTNAQSDAEVDGRMVGIKKIADRSRSTVEKKTLAVVNGIPALLAIAFFSLNSVVAGGLHVKEYFEPEILYPATGVLAGLVMSDVLLVRVLFRRWRRATSVRRRVLARRLGEAKGSSG